MGLKEMHLAQAYIIPINLIENILLRYQIDLDLLNLDTTSDGIFLGGRMLKVSGHDLPVIEMLKLKIELSSHGLIQSDLENWVISEDQIYYLGGEDFDTEFDFARHS